MKSKEELLKMLFATLAELQSGTTESNPGLHIFLLHKLKVLNDILGDDVPEEYWEQIEEQIEAEYED